MTCRRNYRGHRPLFISFYFVLLFTRARQNIGDNSETPILHLHLSSLYHVIYRGLREKWEGVTDSLSDTQRQLEVCLGQLSSFEESREQFSKWLTDTEVKVKLQADLKATLQEKKVQAQSHKVRIRKG